MISLLQWFNLLNQILSYNAFLPLNPVISPLLVPFATFFLQIHILLILKLTKTWYSIQIKAQSKKDQWVIMIITRQMDLYLFKVIWIDNMLNRHILREVGIKDTKSMESNMDTVNFTIKMEGCMKDSGLMVIFKAMENYIINLIVWPMMVNGRRINFVEKVLFTTNIHRI